MSRRHIIAFLVLSLLAVAIHAEPKYDRSFFGRWKDLDHDCEDGREETFKRDVYRSDVQSYKDPYSGQWIDLCRIEIDHIVPLKWAWTHGADSWTQKKRIAFTNDPLNLIAVSRSQNRSKGAKPPSEWMPSDRSFHLAYKAKWNAVLVKYEISF